MSLQRRVFSEDSQERPGSVLTGGLTTAEPQGAFRGPCWALGGMGAAKAPEFKAWFSEHSGPL